MGKWRGGFLGRRILQEWTWASLFVAIAFSTRADFSTSNHLKARGTCSFVTNGVTRWHEHGKHFDPVARGQYCKCRRREHKVFCGDRMVSERRFDVAGKRSILQLAVCRRLPVGQFPECRLPPGVLLETGFQKCTTAAKNIVLGPPKERPVVDVYAPFQWSQFDCEEAAKPYKDMMHELARHEKALGGLRHFRSFAKIVVPKELAIYVSLTHFEYVALQIIGFACATANAKDIRDLNNGEDFRTNVGTQILGQRCGLVWHGAKGNSDHLLTLAGELLIDAFEASEDPVHFFKTAFSRSSDPCLEGRIRLLEGYLMSKQSDAAGGGPSLDDVVARHLGHKATTLDIVGEYLRVFRNECIWRWAQEKEVPLTFTEASLALNSPQLASEDEASFQRLFHAGEFRSYLNRFSSKEFERGDAPLDNVIDFYVENLALPPAPGGSS
eukprot:TRINITY_DN19681_c0_g3_i3.p1 TRINITY_DN19681_c0_g3~~TRINITY_DN19681_c0_g3_i3.p1  ORF type:complete len:458 (+),score=58.12 TRINITY_DN19681_c0_g3_i3:57-1376(+)